MDEGYMSFFEITNWMLWIPHNRAAAGARSLRLVYRLKRWNATLENFEKLAPMRRANFNEPCRWHTISERERLVTCNGKSILTVTRFNYDRWEIRSLNRWADRLGNYHFELCPNFPDHADFQPCGNRYCHTYR